MLNALTPSTRRTYTAAQKRYLNFCGIYHLTPLPLTSDKLCKFAAYLADSSIMHKSIKCYLSGIRHLQITSGLPDPELPSMAQLTQVLRGIKSVQAKEGQNSTRIRLPITSNVLRRMRKVWDREPHKFDHIMLWAACTLCFFSFFRAGEITSPSDASFDPHTHLSFSDRAADSASPPTMMRILLKTSKTDPFRRGGGEDRGTDVSVPGRSPFDPGTLRRSSARQS